METSLVPTADSVRALLASTPSLLDLFAAHPELLANWVVISSRVESSRTISLVLEGGDRLLTVAHEGSEIVDSQLLLSDVDGSLPKLYWTSTYRTVHAYLILSRALPEQASATHLSTLLGAHFDPTALKGVT